MAFKKSKSFQTWIYKKHALINMWIDCLDYTYFKNILLAYS